MLRTLLISMETRIRFLTLELTTLLYHLHNAD